MDLLSELQHAEFKEAFDEFDKVSKQKNNNENFQHFIHWLFNDYSNMIFKKCRLMLPQQE